MKQTRTYAYVHTHRAISVMAVTFTACRSKIYIYIYIYIRVHTCINMCVHTGSCTSIWGSLQWCARGFPYACIHLHICTIFQVSTYAYIQCHIHMHTYRVMYVAFASTVAACRYSVRKRLLIKGNVLQDFFMSLFFVGPLVCVCVCVCVCMYLCMYLHIYTYNVPIVYLRKTCFMSLFCMNPWMYLCTYVSMYIHTLCHTLCMCK